MNSVHWAGLTYVWWILPLLCAAFFITRRVYCLRVALYSLVDCARLKTIFPGYVAWRSWSKVICWWFVFGGVALALLQPQWGKKDQVMVQEGRDLVIMLDVSRSMLAKDLKPNRLEFAKHKIKQLIQVLGCERMALILFAGDAFVQCPITADHAALQMFLENVDQHAISSGSTAIDRALGKACQLFANSSDRQNKLVLVVTDGEDFSYNLDAATQRAIKDQVLVCALGIGSTHGAPVPTLDAQGNQVGHETDTQGKVVLSTLNEPLLQSLCTKLGGTYVRAGYDQSDVQRIANVVQRFEKERFSEQVVSLYHDRYPLFLAVSWAALLLEWLL